MTRTGLRHTQDARRPLYERTRLFKVYCSTVVPGFLQTPAYAGALLLANSGFHATPDDVEDAVRARVSRNRIVQSAGHQFAMLIEEAVLRYRLGGAETMAGQLGHLLNAITLPSVTLGVIPFSADGRPMWTLETFTVFDDSRVVRVAPVNLWTRASATRMSLRMAASVRSSSWPIALAVAAEIEAQGRHASLTESGRQPGKEAAFLASDAAAMDEDDNSVGLCVRRDERGG